MSFKVYLSGEIHTTWREEIKQGAKDKGLDIIFTSPVTNHESSDSAGDHLGEWYKQKTTDKPYAPSKPFNTIF